MASGGTQSQKPQGQQSAVADARVRARQSLSVGPDKTTRQKRAAAVTMGHPDPCPLADRATTRIMTRIATRIRRTPDQAASDFRRARSRQAEDDPADKQV